MSLWPPCLYAYIFALVQPKGREQEDEVIRNELRQFFGPCLSQYNLKASKKFPSTHPQVKTQWHGIRDDKLMAVVIFRFHELAIVEYQIKSTSVDNPEQFWKEQRQILNLNAVIKRVQAEKELFQEHLGTTYLYFAASPEQTPEQRIHCIQTLADSLGIAFSSTSIKTSQFPAYGTLAMVGESPHTISETHYMLLCENDEEHYKQATDFLDLHFRLFESFRRKLHFERGVLAVLRQDNRKALAYLRQYAALPPETDDIEQYLEPEKVLLQKQLLNLKELKRSIDKHYPPNSQTTENEQRGTDVEKLRDSIERVSAKADSPDKQDRKHLKKLNHSIKKYLKKADAANPQNSRREPKHEKLKRSLEQYLGEDIAITAQYKKKTPDLEKMKLCQNHLWGNLGKMRGIDHTLEINMSNLHEEVERLQRKGANAAAMPEDRLFASILRTFTRKREQLAHDVEYLRISLETYDRHVKMLELQIDSSREDLERRIERAIAALGVAIGVGQIAQNSGASGVPQTGWMLGGLLVTYIFLPWFMRFVTRIERTWCRWRKR